MWIYRSKIGVLCIKKLPNGHYGTFLGHHCGCEYTSPIAAADDFYTRSSGINEWDLRPGGDSDAPIDLSEWEHI